MNRRLAPPLARSLQMNKRVRRRLFAPKSHHEASERAYTISQVSIFDCLSVMFARVAVVNGRRRKRTMHTASSRFTHPHRRARQNALLSCVTPHKSNAKCEQKLVAKGTSCARANASCSSHIANFYHMIIHSRLYKKCALIARNFFALVRAVYLCSPLYCANESACRQRSKYFK